MRRYSFLLAAPLLALVSCSGDSRTPSGGRSTIERLVLDQSEVTVGVGGTAQVRATAEDAGGNTVPLSQVSWSGTSTFTVSPGGAEATVTGLTPGAGTLTAVVGAVRAQASVQVQGVPAPAAGDVILMDLRQALQQASTLEQAWALFPGNDHSGARTTRNTSTGWSFTTNFDGQGTRALRADWRANSAGDERNVIISALPTPKPRALCVQYKTYTGRHAADPDGNGEVGAYPVYPNGMSAKRLLFLRDVPNGAATNRIDYTWTRAEPSTARVQINDLNWAVGASTARWTVAGSLNRVYTQTICVEAASANGVSDGVYRMWVDGTLIINLTNAPLQSYGIHRWQFPDTQHNNPIAASEYFWDVLVWTPQALR